MLDAVGGDQFVEGGEFASMRSNQSPTGAW